MYMHYPTILDTNCRLHKNDGCVEANRNLTKLSPYIMYKQQFIKKGAALVDFKFIKT